MRCARACAFLWNLPHIWNPKSIFLNRLFETTKQQTLHNARDRGGHWARGTGHGARGTGRARIAPTAAMKSSRAGGDGHTTSSVTSLAPVTASGTPTTPLASLARWNTLEPPLAPQGMREDGMPMSSGSPAVRAKAHTQHTHTQAGDAVREAGRAQGDSLSERARAPSVQR